MNLAELREQLVIHEGMRLKPYKDSVGKLTIGVGRNLDDVGITEVEALELLENDIHRVMDDLDRNVPWWRTLSEDRQLVFADMVFNLGINRFMGFKNMLRAAKEANYEEAARQMLDSRWATQVGARATKLATAMRSGA